MLKLSKTTMDCWSSWGKDLQRNCTENKDLSFQLWAPVNESLSEQELILTWSHFPAHFFPRAAESSLNSFLLQAGNDNYSKSLCCAKGLEEPLSFWAGAEVPVNAPAGRTAFVCSEQEPGSCCTELPARGTFRRHGSGYRVETSLGALT